MQHLRRIRMVPGRSKPFRRPRCSSTFPSPQTVGTCGSGSQGHPDRTHRNRCCTSGSFSSQKCCTTALSVEAPPIKTERTRQHEKTTSGSETKERTFEAVVKKTQKHTTGVNSNGCVPLCPETEKTRVGHMLNTKEAQEGR